MCVLTTHVILTQSCHDHALAKNYGLRIYAILLPSSWLSVAHYCTSAGQNYPNVHQKIPMKSKELAEIDEPHPAKIGTNSVRSHQFRPPIALRTDLSHITTVLWEIPV